MGYLKRQNKIDKPITMCQLDEMEFTYHRCGGTFDVTNGTWLPIGQQDCSFMEKLSVPQNEPPEIYNFNMRPPELLTSDDFTCYDCIKEDDFQGYDV